MSSERLRPLGPLGPGDPGRALLVLDHATGMRVAAKRLTLPPAVPYDRVRREAMALGAHPSINPVLEVVADGGEAWILSHAIPGRSLRTEIHRLGPLGPAAAAAIGLPVLAALSYAHEHGVVHGNLHPGNVLLGADNSVWVGDFRVPALAEQTTGRLPGFTAPDAPSPAADLWSLGALLYTAALGRPPFARATAAATAEAVRQGVAIEPSDPFTALLRDLMAADPSRRPDPATVHMALQNVSAAPTSDVPTAAAGAVRLPPGSPAPHPPAGPIPSRPTGSRTPRVRTHVLIPGLAGAAVLGAAAALLVPADALTRAPARPPIIASDAASPAPASLDVGPFTKTPRVCGLIHADTLRELVPSATDPFAYHNGDYHSCSWRSDYDTPDAKRSDLSVTLNLVKTEDLARGTFEIDKRVQPRLSQEFRELSGLGHEAFTYTRVTRSPLRRYEVAYKFRLSNLQVTVEYNRAVAVDPDGSITQGAEKVARAVLAKLLDQPG